MTPEQCRMARQMLGWSIERLAAETGLNETTIGRFERRQKARAGARTLRALRAALAAAGVDFLAENDDGAGVRLTKSCSGPVA